jgi:hypothetical protein
MARRGTIEAYSPGAVTSAEDWQLERARRGRLGARSDAADRSSTARQLAKGWDFLGSAAPIPLQSDRLARHHGAALNTTSLYGVAPGSGGVDCVARSTSIPSSPSRISTTSARSIEFDPARGGILGVDRDGRLLRVSPTTGGILEVVGQTGLGRTGGITGLAFVAPEPGTGSLLVLGLCGLAFASRRRARVRHNEVGWIYRGSTSSSSFLAPLSRSRSRLTRFISSTSS